MARSPCLSAGLLALACSSASAVCPLNPPQVYVGDTASDASCDYNDIQPAIDAVGSCPVVINITREHLYQNRHLGIPGKKVVLAGWGDGETCQSLRNFCSPVIGCIQTSTEPLVTIDASNTAGSVLYVTGNSNVTLRNLTITGGDAGSGSGGGINFDGSGSLNLQATTVNFNKAGYGAGINMHGAGGAAALNLLHDSLVIFNTAGTSGGGIRVEGDTRLYALQPNTLIGFNHAPNGYGGGVEVLGPARADIGSSGYGGLGVINGNDAAYGGGIDILTFDNGAHAIVRLFTTDPGNPVKISDNFASHTGGAVYLKPLYGFSSAASVLCAYDFRVEGNVAQEGAAIYSDAEYDILGLGIGGSIALNTNPYFAFGETENFCVKTEPPPALGAVACAAGVECNRFTGNLAQDQNGTPTDGSTILLQSGSDLQADRVSLRDNEGAHVVRLIGDDDYAPAYFRNCLFADNVADAGVDRAHRRRRRLSRPRFVHGGRQPDRRAVRVPRARPVQPVQDHHRSARPRHRRPGHHRPELRPIRADQRPQHAAGHGLYTRRRTHLRRPCERRLPPRADLARRRFRAR